MSDEVVLDASVAVDWLLPGPGSAAALTFMRLGARRIAPDLIFAEFASAATKFVRRGLTSKADARAAVERLPRLIDQVASLGDLAGPAYDLATSRGFSAYDSLYLALALRRGLRLVTADAKLARRAADVGFSAHVHLLTPES
ncbi:type II toxin-antitoxin system VapC family toxin [Caulobacter sp. DWR2-3-1b2]|uniref:type II toxin-antitoxin system VapC family toxin n=1 Tax=unclassified Caulobacter TaxID=2648921 RepID=UPI003CE8779E